jgi:formylglycine-generating enzyme required for sulfatase activity
VVAVGVLFACAVVLLVLYLGTGSSRRANSPDSTSTSASSADNITNTIGMKLRRIPVGRFVMGSPPNETGRLADEDHHEVEIAKPFAVGTHKVTVGQFRTFVKAKGYQTEGDKARDRMTWQNPGFAQSDAHPVVCVSWQDAMAFCAWLSEQEAKSYSLPTEAEWEYTCRAGARTRHYFGDDGTKLTEYAWFKANAGSMTHPVGQLRPNAWGLYDMHGNTWEWVADWYAWDYYKRSPAADPAGPDTGRNRVMRGGGYYDEAADCRSARRHGVNAPNTRNPNVGFRVVLRLPAAKP